MDSRCAVVITTVQSPTPAVRKWIAVLQETSTAPIIIGDAKGPFAYDERCEFYSFERQSSLKFNLSKSLPVNHYARKNLGYLVAAEQGAEIIYETDDDNCPMAGWDLRMRSRLECRQVKTTGWVNAFRYFTDEKIWPRGFPLDEILKPLPLATASGADCYAPIQQGLANGEADVDAIWRLLFDRSIVFDEGDPIFLGKRRWCPFNSQSTWWHRETLPLMYLPSCHSRRMTDIWRSFVAQRCLWEIDAGVIFHGPEVFQTRNPHVIIDDFKQEIDGYLRNRDICDCLEALNLSPKDMIANVVKCYEALVRAGHFPEGELRLVYDWSKDVERVGSAGVHQRT